MASRAKTSRSRVGDKDFVESLIARIVESVDPENRTSDAWSVFARAIDVMAKP